jgi:hypothetical protein
VTGCSSDGILWKKKKSSHRTRVFSSPSSSDQKHAEEETEATLASTSDEVSGEERETLDKLIDVFRKKDEKNWQRLMAQSRQWPTVNDKLLKRLKSVGEGEEKGEEREALLGLHERLEAANEIHKEKSELFHKLVDASDFDREALVALYSLKLDNDFFEFSRDVIVSYKGDRKKQEECANIMSAVIALREAAKEVLEGDEENLQEAAKQFAKILEATSLDDAEKQIDGLIDTGGMDPALLMMMAKAWAGAKESNMMKEEAKDIMFHLYNKARDGLSQQQPSEFKILKYVVSQPTRREKWDALEEAFTPGLNYESGDVEYLSTTPEKLFKTVESVLNVYELQRMKFMSASHPSQALKTKRQGDLTGSEVFTGMMREAQQIPGQNVIDELREIRFLIRKDFLTGQMLKDERDAENELWMGESGKL